MRYSVDVFLGDQVLNALKTDNLAEAYKKFAELIDLVELRKLDTVVIFDDEIDASMKIIAQVSSFDF
jgi:hypothetical protein